MGLRIIDLSFFLLQTCWFLQTSSEPLREPAWSDRFGFQTGSIYAVCISNRFKWSGSKSETKPKPKSKPNWLELISRTIVISNLDAQICAFDLLTDHRPSPLCARTITFCWRCYENWLEVRSNSHIKCSFIWQWDLIQRHLRISKRVGWRNVSHGVTTERRSNLNKAFH